MSRELMPKSGIMMPHVVVNRDAAVVGVSTVDGVAGAIDLTGKYLQKTDAEATYLTKTDGATKTFVTDVIEPIMTGALFKDDPVVANDVPFRSGGANGVESVDMIKVTPENTIKLGSYASSVQGVEIHSAGRLQVVDQNDGGVETKYPVYSKRYRPEIEDLPFAAIGSYVRDSKGRTIGVNRTGINSDIKQFTEKVTFQEPVTVADAVGDYDAVTLRQLRNSGGGSGGPTLSGISNFGIGDFHLRDSRAFIPAFEVVSDGQLLSRADYPDLWAYAQLLTPITDADWLASPSKRGRYSLGNGTTTFRVPDRNGVQADSIGELFGRGDGGNSAAAGDVFINGAPDISGSLSVYTYLTGNASGAFAGTSSGSPVVNTSNPYQDTRYGNYTFSANRSNAAYGRSTKVRPDNFVGVWTIRAHGGFVAANTSWSVINGDATRPLDGTAVDGGQVISKYQVGGVDEAATSLRVRGQIGGNYYARLAVENATSSNAAWYDFNEDGGFSAGSITCSGNIVTKDAFNVRDTGWPSVRFMSNRYNTPSTNIGALTILECTGLDGAPSSVSLIRRRGDDNSTGQVIVSFPTTAGILALQGTSGIEYKKDVTDADAQEAMDRINGQRLVNFVYKDDEQERVRFGIIAEEAEVITPQYIKHHSEPYEDILDEAGNKVGEKTRDRPSVDTNPIVMDLIGAVQYLKREVDQLKAELAELKASK